MKQVATKRNLVLVSTLALVLAGCARPEVILPGLREGLRSPDYDTADANAVGAATERASADFARFENLSRPANLGPQSAVGSWTHRGYDAAHDLPHGTLSAAPALIWSSKAGAANTRENRITAEPVSDGARIYAMDGGATVTAHGMGGGLAWSADITPAGERARTGSGGGLALSGGTLYATTSFGELVALDAATGAVQWRQKFDGAVSGAPTVSGGKVFVSTANSIAYAVTTDTGRIAWRKSGVPSHSGVAGVGAPAVSGNVVVYPLANTSMLGVDAGSGDIRWVAKVAGGRAGAARSVLKAFTGEPVIDGGTIYAATAGGRAVAVGLQDGKIRWEAEEGAQGTMAVAGGAVFFVNDQARLVRLSAGDGAKVWEVDLPRYVKADKPRRLKSIFPAYGPVMAGGRLWVASGDGVLRSFNPTDGSPLGEVALPAGAASRPITLAGMLVLMTEKGDLIGLR
ncbi:MAG: PQQ-binding-like beta-propeller repeat protein [Maritimibacter sp.]|nr:PQQ-binding-like beta-propeller repeat protein [Maritimibacter sp.]